MAKSSSVFKYFFRIIVLTIIVLGAYWYLSGQPQTLEEGAARNGGGVITFLEGAVEYKEAGGEWKRAGTDMDLFEGYSLETMQNSKAIVQLDDGSAVRLNSNTLVTFLSLDPNNIVIVNEKGVVYTRVTEMERTFAVQADDVVFEAMGTAYTTINREDELGVEVYESQVKISCEGKDEVIVEEGKKYYTKNELDKEKEAVMLEMTEQEIEANEFVQWNKAMDAELLSVESREVVEPIEAQPVDSNMVKGVESVKLVTPTEVVVEKVEKSKSEISSGVESISLSSSGNGKVTWKTNGYSIKGYKLVWSKTSGPTYPTRSSDKYLYFSDPNANSGTVTAFDGAGTYYVRVCEYLGGSCGKYSNEITVELEGSSQEASKVTSIALSGSGSSVSWSVNGYSEKGFKVVWSKTSGPTYPTRSSDSYQYFGSPTASSATLDAFDGSGTYYVRVCEYLGGKCGVYSNEITLDL